MRVEPGFLRPLSVTVLPPAGSGNQHDAIAKLLPNLTGGAVSVKPGHADIEQHHVWAKPRCRFHRFDSIVGGVDLMPAQLQEC